MGPARTVNDRERLKTRTKRQDTSKRLWLPKRYVRGILEGQDAQRDAAEMGVEASQALLRRERAASCGQLAKS